MKIAIIFDLVPRNGGAFNQSINTIKRLKRLCGELFDIEVYHLESGGATYLNEIGLRSTPLRHTVTSRIFEAAIRSSSQSARRRLSLISPREKCLISKGVDLVYFPSPSSFALSLQTLKYIVTIYDVGHRDFPEFPESGFEAREAYNWRAMIRAVLTIVDSEALKLKLQRMYGLTDERILTIPFTVPCYLQSVESASEDTPLQKYGLKNGYLFYPAQFWAHKNHVRILQALRLLKERGLVVHAAFSGSDKGGQAHVMATALKLGIMDQIHVIGFVPSAHLTSLYKNSLALIMPTYFGPTNLPPLEAWSLDVPVIYSKHLSAEIEDGVLPVDPDSPESIAMAIEKVIQEDIRRGLIDGGRRCLAQVEKRADASEETLRQHLERFAKRRETWA